MNKTSQGLRAGFIVLAALLLLGIRAGHADPKGGHKQEMEQRGRGHGEESKDEEKGKGSGSKHEKSKKGSEHKYEVKRDQHRYKVEYKGYGPPPWAEAHGYRRNREPAPTAVASGHVVPHRIDVGRCNRATVGAVLGGTAGGALGSKVGGGMGKDAAIIAGSILGVIVGGEIGRWMDTVDQACAAQTLEYAGGSRNVEWVNPDNGAVYQVTPTETYRTGEDRYCREYRAQANLGGRTQEVFGTACRQPDGSWQLVNQ